MSKSYVVCTTCGDDGIFKPLGMIDQNGDFWIKRRLDYTIISGASFEVLCSKCGQPAYKKERGGTNEMSYQRIEWVYRVGSSVGTQIQGT